MRIKLVEASSDKKTVYIDSKTNKMYEWDGSRFVEIENDSSNQSSGSDNQTQPQKPPKIGDKGNQDIQKAEQQERDANAYNPENDQKNKSENDSDNSDDDNQADDSDSAEENADQPQLNKELSDSDYKSTESRIERIKRILSDPKYQKKISSENSKAIEKEVQAKAARDTEKYKASSLYRLEASMNDFLKSQIDRRRIPSWKKFNKTYAGSGIIRKGSMRNRDKVVPVINVYFDRSGSWDDRKTESGIKAVASLNDFVRRGLIKVNLFYFAMNVHSDRQAAESEGGTRGQPILDHIKATKPDNVIVMTDSDISDCTTDIEVPGAVWILFKDGVSENLKQHLHGKEMTKYFDM